MSKSQNGRGASFYVSERGEAWQPANKILHQTKLTGRILTPELMGVEWESMPGNRPATNGNLLAVWQNDAIPPGQDPIQKQSISVNQQSGGQTFSFPIQRKTYVVGYGTSDTDTAWAASLLFTPGSVDGKPFVTGIDVVAVANDFLVAKFETWKNNVPKAAKNWMGLWEGSSVTWDGTNRIKKVDIDSSVNDGQQQMDGLTLKINTTYSLAYAVGPKDTDLAAWMTFTTVPF